jgi:hypothetical protein
MKNIFLPKLANHGKWLTVFFLSLMILTAFSCKQSSIFFNISTENPPKDPRIPGSPSKIVAVETATAGGLAKGLYLARNGVWFYGGSMWEKMENQPPADGDIVNIAVTTDALFIQTAHPDYELWKTEDGTTWTQIENNTDFPTLQGIYAAGDKLFAAGAIRTRGSDNDGSGIEKHSVLYCDSSSDELVFLPYPIISEGNTGFMRLTGALYVNSAYYLSHNGGIYKWDGVLPPPPTINVTPVNGTYEEKITGIIADAAENMLAVTSNGKILTSPAGTDTFTEQYDDDDDYLNGALNIAQTSTGAFVLMLGYASGGISNYGYREIVLNDDGSFPSSGYSLNVPGSFPDSTIVYNRESNAEYKSSLGREILTSVIQTPAGIDPNQTLFASTFVEGLWSYRNGEWNAEE